MTDEEKKAIERVEQFIDGERQYNTKTGETIIPYEYGESQRFVYKETYYAIQVVLNLIEKQYKQIEGLIEVSKECIEEKFNNDKKWEDKIKAKIEEYEKKIKKIKEKVAWEEPYDTEKYVRYTNYIYVLQSLLEKE